MTYEDDWPDMLIRQHGIVTRRQVLARGLTDDVIRAHLDARRWAPAGTGVYSTTTGPLTVQAARWAAVLACWPCALKPRHRRRDLGAPPASARGSGAADLTRPYGLSVVRASGVDVRRSRAFAHIVAPDSDPPVVSMAHTAIDLAVDEEGASRAISSMLRSLVATHLQPAAVRVAMEKRRPRRWKGALLDALSYAEGGVTSALEARWTGDVERAHALPSPERQFPVAVDGVRRSEDLLYRHRGVETVVRLDGRRFHAVESANLLDRRRANAAELAGRRHLVYGWREVTESPCTVAAEVAEVLGLDLTRCARCPERARCLVS